MEEYFWSLTIETGWIQAAIWTIKQSLASGAGKQSEAHVTAVSNAVHWETDEDLITGADTALSSIVSGLGETVKEPSKTVFGVSSGWVEEGQIKKEHLEKIRNICQKLSLTPSGFVILPEAIAHFKKSEENAPLSAIIIGVGADAIDVTVVRLGNISGTVNVGRSLSVVDDVVEGIARFGKSEPFPSRFLIYDGKSVELDDVKQDLIKADWTGELKGKAKFLHTPQVEIIDPKMKMVAVSLAGASEIGQAKVVTFDLGDEKGERRIKAEVQRPQDDKKVEGIGTAQDVGFVMDQDINKVWPPSVVNKVSPESRDMVQDRNEDRIPQRSGNVISRVKNNIVSFPSFLKSKLRPSSRMDLGGEGEMNKKTPIIVAAGLAVLLVLGFIAWWFLPKADVTIFVSPKLLEESQKVTYDPKATNPNISQRILPVSTVSTTVNGDKTRTATGTVTVGNKAKGTVVIRNSTPNGIGLSAGTILLGPNSLNFTLDQSASVSAKTSTTTPGTTNATVTAANFGAEYNLAKGEVLQVGNFSKLDVDALVDSDFSGGSSQEVVAISKDDLTNLQGDLTSELTDKAKQQLQEKLGDGEVLLDTATVATASAVNFDHQIGDQVSTLKLSETLNINSLVVSKKNLNELARDIIKGKVPNGFVVKDDQISVSFGQTDKAGSLKIDTKFSVNLLPEIDTADIAKKIAGKYPKVAQDYLSKIPGYVRVEIQRSARIPLPSFLSTLPHVVKNISIELSSEK